MPQKLSLADLDPKSIIGYVFRFLHMASGLQNYPGYSDIEGMSFLLLVFAFGLC
ncbi:unnamed protein product [Acidithrix sp. C25]|nr:unnamed protein product [Acidithrix sp. C25]